MTWLFVNDKFNCQYIVARYWTVNGQYFEGGILGGSRDIIKYGCITYVLILIAGAINNGILY